MAVTAEIAAYVASLGDNETWQKLPDWNKADYTIIKKFEEQVCRAPGLNLMGLIHEWDIAS